MDQPGRPADEQPRVCCSECNREVEEDDAQAQRWGYWLVAGDPYPLCPDCAQRKFGSDQS
jgi:hypothetical protein